MPRSAVRKSRPSDPAVRSRHKKALFLPMKRADADGLVLPVRLAFEQIRCGKADRGALITMAEILLLTGFLTEAGFGQLDTQFLDSVEKRCLTELNSEPVEEWKVAPDLITHLGCIVNEYDRLIRETRLQAIMAANESFSRLKRATM